MKKAIKIICILIIALIIVAMIILNSSKAAAVGFYANSSQYNVGDDVVVTFKINDGRSGAILLCLDYSTDLLQIQEITEQDGAYSVKASNGPNNAEVIYLQNDIDVTTDTLVIRFKAIKRGEAYINLKDTSKMSVDYTDLVIQPQSINIMINESIAPPVDNEPPILDIISGSTTAMNIGDTATISVNKEVSWSSSNNSVATVSSGVITAVGEGSATISATASNGKKAEISVTVNAGAPSNPVIEKLQIFANGSTNLVVGGSVKITANKQILMWESSNNAVATVSEAGDVIAVGVGEVIITATDVDAQTSSLTVSVSQVDNQNPGNQENPGNQNNSGNQNNPVANGGQSNSGNANSGNNGGGNTGNSNNTGSGTTVNNGVQTNNGQVASVTDENVPATGENTIDIVIAVVVITCVIAMVMFRRKSK